MGNRIRVHQRDAERLPRSQVRHRPPRFRPCSASLATSRADPTVRPGERIARDRGNLYKPSPVPSANQGLPGLRRQQPTTPTQGEDADEDDGPTSRLCAARPDTTSDVTFESAVETLVTRSRGPGGRRAHAAREPGGGSSRHGDDYFLYFEPPTHARPNASCWPRTRIRSSEASASSSRRRSGGRPCRRRSASCARTRSPAASWAASASCSTGSSRRRTCSRRSTRSPRRWRPRVSSSSSGTG